MLRSFIEVSGDSHFPIQNLPYGVFHPRRGGKPRIGVAIGDWILDLSVVEAAGYLKSTAAAGTDIFDRASLNAYMSLGRQVWHNTRKELQRLLSLDNPALRDDAELRAQALIPQAEADMLLPAEIGDYTDFYASREHAANVGTMFRGKENALMPNWTHLPVGYSGRASSIVVSGTDVRRPLGQMKPADADLPVFGPSKQLDFELEIGWFIGKNNELGSPVPIEQAEDHIFGLVLVNDWSARDIQSWEYQPLGPFLSKNFATSISPWIVPLEALEPFRIAAEPPERDPLPYLRQTKASSYDIRLEVSLQAEGMNEPVRISASHFRHMYWTMAQQIAHHTIGGCNLRVGDLLASGTISGPHKESRGCMLELTWRGAEPLHAGNGIKRTWLEDGDQIAMTGWCDGDGYRIGFGEVKGRILPSLTFPDGH